MFAKFLNGCFSLKTMRMEGVRKFLLLTHSLILLTTFKQKYDDHRRKLTPA